MSSSSTRLREAGSITVKRATRAAPPRTARVTVLFVDLRGYTALAELLAPALIVPLLKEFFNVLAKAATSHRGTVFHMAGDGMMAGFGGHGLGDDGAREALAAANAMLQEFGVIAARWRRDLSIETGIGVGMHLGEVAMGLLGPPGHKWMTLVGDTVNVAARLCARARAGEVLLSCTVAAALDIDDRDGEQYVGPIPVLHLPQYALRGRSAPLDIWCVPVAKRLVLSAARPVAS